MPDHSVHLDRLGTNNPVECWATDVVEPVSTPEAVGRRIYEGLAPELGAFQALGRTTRNGGRRRRADGDRSLGGCELTYALTSPTPRGSEP